ncbi:MAG: DUF4199 domain-containing protein [Flavobacteriales bacterium]|nr:DUF4199 domain-containing protein [Flavobacteriales bacterium]
MERANFPYFLAFVWLLLKAGLKYTSFYSHTYEIGIGLNLLFLPFIVLFAIRPFFKEKGHSGLFIAKQGMKSGAIYALCVSLGSLLYYKWIDPEFTQNRFDQHITYVEEQLQEEGRFEELQKDNPTLRNLTKEDYLEKEIESAEKFNSPMMIATFSLLALMILVLCYSLLMAVLFKLLINRS